MIVLDDLGQSRSYMVAIKADLICQGNNHYHELRKWNLSKTISDWIRSETNGPEVPEKKVIDGDEN